MQCLVFLFWWSDVLWFQLIRPFWKNKDLKYKILLTNKNVWKGMIPTHSANCQRSHVVGEWWLGALGGGMDMAWPGRHTLEKCLGNDHWFSIWMVLTELLHWPKPGLLILVAQARPWQSMLGACGVTRHSWRPARHKSSDWSGNCLMRMAGCIAT